MNARVATIATVVTIVALGAIASERMRAYRVGCFRVDARTVAICVTVTATSGWFTSRGIAGIETPFAFGVAAIAAITDLQCGYVFDRVLFAGGAGLVVVAAAGARLPAGFAGAGLAAALLVIPWALSRGRGVGLGDVKLAGVLGLALGPYGAIRALWFAFVAGAIVAVACIVTRRRSKSDALPFAPFVALGAIVSAGSNAW